MEKVTRRVNKRWSGMLVASDVVWANSTSKYLEYSQDHADLGAAMNAFSLNESEALAGAIEKTGQAVDTTYISTTKLVGVSLFA